ncbi:pentatricopeptide repeat-containing protein At5g39350-like [Coffea eugenioides]|uniref:pentatricopeptide repeat-containing protein At5g39350-like n=1 Tax=Coffea eugenioides TaxID=49369 RepID=UPI000F613ABD|nr:pentatricopeptide repeat-containing protein At5g39350-like [Coffea eugenioides]
MIRAFGMNGCGQAAVKLLEEVCSSGVSPNSLTFSSVLSTCSHSGLVNDGLKIFDRMSTDFGFKPETGHFTCLVDLLARAGQLDDAVDFIRKMPHGPDKHSWGSILAASLEQQSIRIGVLASEHLVNLEPENAGHYVTLSNLYAKAGRPDDAVRVRRLMESRGLVKQFGYSSVSLVASFNSQRVRSRHHFQIRIIIFIQRISTSFSLLKLTLLKTYLVAGTCPIMRLQKFQWY